MAVVAKADHRQGDWALFSVQDECQKPHRAVHVVEVQVEGVCEEGLASGSWARDGLVGWPGRVGLGPGAWQKGGDWVAQPF